MVERAGTVTFLFTDIQGSTQLVKQLRDGYGEVMGEHQRILREAFTAQGGEEVDTQGDSFFYVFPTAREAALAAAEAQRGMAAHSWPEGAVFRVRIGMHTGEPTVSEAGRYHGLGVHRTARIMAAGHGGQVLASQATAAVLEDDEPPGIGLKDLGEHHLKDLDRPEHIYQLVIDGLPQEFPPLRTADSSFWTRRRAVVGGAAVLAIAVLATGMTLGLGRAHRGLSQVDANAVGLVEASSGKISGQVRVGGTPTHVAVGEGAIWVTNADGRTVSRIDPTTHNVQTIQVGNSPSGITTGSGDVWVANSLDGTVSRINPSTNTAVQTITVGNGPDGIAYAAGAVWVANTGDQTITKIDAGTGIPQKTLPIAASELATGNGTLWVSEGTQNRVVLIDPTTSAVVNSVQVGNGPSGIAFGNGAAWVANSLDGTVSRIDPVTDSVTTASIGRGATTVAAGDSGVWVTDEIDGTLVQIDPHSGHVVRTIDIGNRPQGVAMTGDTVLVGVRQSDAGHQGGTLTMRMNRDLDSIDTAIAYDSTSWPFLRMTNDGLVAFNQAGGLAGTQLVPDLAVSLPAPTNGGKTYTFRLRPNIHYSTGQVLKASDVLATFERDFEVKNFPVPVYYDSIIGAKRCEQVGTHCDLSKGIVADDTAGNVTFNLTKADPEFLEKLALPFAYVLPAGTSPRIVHTHPLPATGPYTIASYVAGHVLKLVPNPDFHEWSKAAQPAGYPEQIVVDIGGTPDQAVNEVIAGTVDAFSSSQSQNPPSGSLLARLQVQYPAQVHINSQPNTVGLFMNTNLAPFDRVAVRRALNYAADRAAAVEALGGPEVEHATCQILPPHFPGYKPYCPYTSGSTTSGVWTAPNMKKARAWVAASGTSNMKITFYSWDGLPSLGPFAVKLLRSVGYSNVSMKVFDDFGVTGDSSTKAQIGTTEWISDYPTASGFFIPILTCRSFTANDPGNANDSQFCDPAIDHQIDAAVEQQATNPDAARGLWESIDRQTVNQAPWVSLVNPNAVDVVSKRVGNYQYSPPLGLLIDQLWVK